MIKYVFNSIKRDNSQEIAKCVKTLYNSTVPVIVCVGTDLIVGDSLGPLVGSRLKTALNGSAFIYGTLDNPITAKEVTIISEKLKIIHPRSKILIVDAAVGNTMDVGQIKVSSFGIKPGLGVNKNLPLVGDVSIIGIVSDGKTNSLYGGVRLSLINSLADDIVRGLTIAFAL